MTPSATGDAPETPVAPRLYARTRNSRIKAYLRPVVAAGLVAGMLYVIRGNTPGGWAIVGLAVLITVAGTWAIYGVANASRESFTLGPDWLEYTTYSSSRVYTQDEIDSFETVSADLVFIYFKTPTDSFISFDDGIEHAGEIRRWLNARYLNRQAVQKQQTVVQAQAAQAAVLTRPELGSTPRARSRSFKRLRRLANGLNVAGYLTFLGIWLPPEASEWTIIAGLLLPLATIAALWAYPTLLRLDGEKSNGHPGVVSAFLVPSLTLVLVQLATNLVSYRPLWPVAGAAALATAGLLVFGSRHFLRRPQPPISLGLLILVLAALYGFGASAAVNQQFDAAPAKQFPVRVLARREETARYQNSYYLTTERWGYATNTTTLRVSYHVYARTETDSLVRISLHPGFLGIPWYEASMQ